MSAWLRGDGWKKWYTVVVRLSIPFTFFGKLTWLIMSVTDLCCVCCMCACVCVWLPDYSLENSWSGKILHSVIGHCAESVVFVVFVVFFFICCLLIFLWSELVSSLAKALQLCRSIVMILEPIICHGTAISYEQHVCSYFLVCGCEAGSPSNLFSPAVAGWSQLMEHRSSHCKSRELFCMAQRLLPLQVITTLNLR